MKRMGLFIHGWMGFSTWLPPYLDHYPASLISEFSYISN